MSRTAASFKMGPEFEEFLFAPVGEDRNGMLLSVLSALARLNVDPWREAAKLAGLPVEAATRQLASLLATLPDRPAAEPDAETIAARLVRLLPGRSGPRQPAAGPATAGRAPAASNKHSRAILIIVMIVLVMGVHYVMADRQAPADTGNARPSISNTHPPPGK